MTKRILLLGKNGQVGSALEAPLARLGNVFAYDRLTCNLSDPDKLEAVVETIRPNVIVNAAAYTAVDQAEKDESACNLINSQAPSILAAAATRHNALLVHYSTDYVFDGMQDRAYVETDAPNPLNSYGRSKLAGDYGIRDASGKYIILRVGWVYSETGKNFAKTILRLASERERLTIVNDQFGAPTSASLIANTTVEIVRRYFDTPPTTTFPYGLYHLAAAGRASWHDFALELVTEARRIGHDLRVDTQNIVPIPTEQYPTPALRPQSAVLNTLKLRETFNLSLPEWRSDVSGVVYQLAAEHALDRLRAFTSDRPQAAAATRSR